MKVKLISIHGDKDKFEQEINKFVCNIKIKIISIHHSDVFVHPYVNRTVYIYYND